MSTLLAGYGESALTPPLGVDLAGYGFYLPRRAESVLDDLKARALLLRTADDEATRLLLVDCDLYGLDVGAVDGLRRALAADLEMDPRHVVLAFTHTHSGPVTQEMLGRGSVDAAYLASLPGRLRQAARAAAADLSEAAVSASELPVEPIGYNRRKGDFQGIDASLKVLAFARKGGRILVLGYACHPSTLGRGGAVSADWPGAVVGALEARGERALVLQGFCGDIDPVALMEPGSAGGEADLRLYGHLLAERALKAAAAARPEPLPELKLAERRLRVSLRVPGAETIDREALKFLSFYSRLPGAERFADEWQKAVHARRTETARRPFLEDVPVVAAAVGRTRLVGLPGEPFTGCGLALRKEFPGAFPFAFANGHAGYLPPPDAFMDPRDYACHCAPLYARLFPFTRDVEPLMMDAARAVLQEVKP